VARQRGTSRRQVRSNGGSGAVGARGKPGAGAEGEQDAEAGAEAGVGVEAEGEAGGVPLTAARVAVRKICKAGSDSAWSSGSISESEIGGIQRICWCKGWRNACWQLIYNTLGAVALPMERTWWRKMANAICQKMKPLLRSKSKVNEIVDRVRSM